MKKKKAKTWTPINYISITEERSVSRELMDYRKRKGQRSRFCYFSFSILEKGEMKRVRGQKGKLRTQRQEDRRGKKRERQRNGETQWNGKLGREKKLYPKYMDIESTVGGGFQSLSHVLCL